MHARHAVSALSQSCVANAVENDGVVAVFIISEHATSEQAIGSGRATSNPVAEERSMAHPTRY